MFDRLKLQPMQTHQHTHTKQSANQDCLYNRRPISLHSPPPTGLLQISEKSTNPTFERPVIQPDSGKADRILLDTNPEIQEMPAAAVPRETLSWPSLTPGVTRFPVAAIPSPGFSFRSVVLES
jgi:hypothetical protein